jgi:hypothetical protein
MTDHRCLDNGHVRAIWSARFSQELWESALSTVCEVRPDLVAYVAQLAESHTGIEAIALRYCAGTDRSALMSMLEHLLERSDNSLKDEPFAIFRLRNLDWRGREFLYARNLGRDLPKLREAMLHPAHRSSPMRGGVVDLATLLPAIELVRDLRGDSNWWERYQLSEVVAELGDPAVQAYCLAALVNGPDWLRDWVKKYYLTRVEGLTSDTLDDDMIAVLLADFNVPDQITVHGYNPLGSIATDRLVIERLLPLAQGASVAVRQNLALVLDAAGDRHGKRYLMPA